MGFINFSVRRPVAIFCLTIAIIGLGLNAYRKLPLEELPKTDMPYVTVVTVFPGASPDQIETDLAKPIEDAVGAIDGLKNLTSSCMENACQTFLEFHVGVDVDRAANDIRERLDLIINDFPEGVEKPRVLKFDINAQPIINLALTGDRPIAEIYDYAENEFRDRMSTVPGVAEISITGGAKSEVQVLLDRKKLAARSLTSIDIVAAMRQEIKLIPAGRIRDQGLEYSIKFDADIATVDQLETLEIANKEGQRCYIRDIGRVIMGSEEMRQAAAINGKPCVAIRVIKKADANALEVVKNTKSALKMLNTSLPGGIEIIWVADEGDYIEASVSSATSNIWQGILLTAILMFFFLYNFKSTLTVAITMPITIIAGIFFIHLLGYSLNTVTLLALGLSIGILVTNSIVVLESIVSVLQNAKSSQEAAIKGTDDVFSAVIASAGTNIVVLFPLSLMEGQIGQFFIPFATTMVGITVISLIVSFTLTPAVAGRFITQNKDNGGRIRKLEALWNKAFGRFIESVIQVVNKITASRTRALISISIAVLLLLHALTLIPKIGFSFLPITDRGEAIVKLEFPSSFGLEKTSEQVSLVDQALADIPGLKFRLTTIGKVDGNVGQSSEGVHLAQIMCIFSEKSKRSDTIFELREMIRTRIANLPDVISGITLPDQVGAGAEIKLVITGQEFAVLDRLCLKLSEEAGKTDWLSDMDSSVRPGKNELRIFPKRAVLGDLKIPATQLGLALRTNIEGTKASTFKQDARTYDIRVKLDEQQGLDQIAQLELPGMPGHPVILENFAHIERHQSPILITRRNKNRAAMFYANPTKGTPLNTAAQNVQKLVEGKNGLPAGYAVDFLGKVEAMRDGMSDFIEVGVTAFILTYLLLAAILNSFTRPLIILVTIPLGLTGCLWALYLTGEPISMMVMLGGVMLIGIVVNNAILIMDKLQQCLDEGLKPSQAMQKALRQEMRSVTMITLAAVFGMLPMALDSGLGSELRSGIGIAAMGGIIISAVLTLLILPAVYRLTNPDKP